MTPNQYIESLYEKQGFKVVCSNVQVTLEHNTATGKNLEGNFTLVNCSNPENFLTVEGFQFLNVQRTYTEALNISGSKYRLSTGVVDFYFFSSGGEVAAGLLQSFAEQFSKGA